MKQASPLNWGLLGPLSVMVTNKKGKFATIPFYFKKILPTPLKKSILQYKHTTLELPTIVQRLTLQG